MSLKQGIFSPSKISQCCNFGQLLSELAINSHWMLTFCNAIIVVFLQQLATYFTLLHLNCLHWESAKRCRLQLLSSLLWLQLTLKNDACTCEYSVDRERREGGRWINAVFLTNFVNGVSLKSLSFVCCWWHRLASVDSHCCCKPNTTLEKYDL